VIIKVGSGQGLGGGKYLASEMVGVLLTGGGTLHKSYGEHIFLGKKEAQM